VETLFKLWTSYLASGVEGIAGILIAIAALQATFRALLLFFRRAEQTTTDSSEPASSPENIRLRLGRWLALALEFELGADILRTAIAPSWAEIGQLAAIATIRTLLNYFLQKEIDRAALRQPESAMQSYKPPASTPSERIRNVTKKVSDAL
jgi:uncharacterized membrane protein